MYKQEELSIMLNWLFEATCAQLCDPKVPDSKKRVSMKKCYFNCIWFWLAMSENVREWLAGF